jgi:hypothetical protein
MKKYIIFDDSGVLHGRLIDGMHKIPAHAVHVPDDIWHRTIQETAQQWIIDAHGVIGQRPHPLPAKVSE